jgi:hypothetical protein
MRRITTCFLALATSLLMSTPLYAQEAWATQVRTLLEGVGATFKEQGYALTHEILTGSLDEGGNTSLRLDLDGGMDYQIMGACDTDCSDLDIVLYDSKDNEIDSDLLLDDAPLVSVSPSGSGTYRVEVRMATCSVEPCYFGVGVWGN